MSFCQRSFVCGRLSIFYVCFMCYFGHHWKIWRETKQKVIPTAFHRYHQKKKKKNHQKKKNEKKKEKKKGTSGWDLFVVACFQPTTSIDHLQVNHCFDLIKVILCWSMLFNVIFCLTDFTFSVCLFILCQNEVLCTVEAKFFFIDCWPQQCCDEITRPRQKVTPAVVLLVFECVLFLTQSIVWALLCYVQHCYVPF